MEKSVTASGSRGLSVKPRSMALSITSLILSLSTTPVEPQRWNNPLIKFYGGASVEFEEGSDIVHYVLFILGIDDEFGRPDHGPDDFPYFVTVFLDLRQAGTDSTHGQFVDRAGVEEYRVAFFRNFDVPRRRNQRRVYGSMLQCRDARHIIAGSENGDIFLRLKSVRL